MVWKNEVDMEKFYEENWGKFEELYNCYKNELEMYVRDCKFEVVVVEKKFKM